MSKKNIHHDYISIKQSRQTAWFRVGNYCVLLTFIIASKFGVTFPEAVYYILVGAIIGVDVGKLANGFLKR